MKTYIQFEEQVDKETFKKVFFVRILERILPKANPDFEDKIDEVRCWLLEFDSETGKVQREIGLDKEGHIVLKAPFRENYGFWTDSPCLFSKDSFKAIEISKDNFEDSWELFDKLSNFENEILNE